MCLSVKFVVLVTNLLTLRVGKMLVFGKWKGVLPPGYEMVDGEAIDVTDKVIQVTTPGSTQYFAFENPMGRPIYVRSHLERGWHFIVFDDPYNRDPGGGHLVVLQRMTGLSVDGGGRIIYEAFLLSLEASIAADVEPYDPIEFDYYREETKANVRKDSNYIRAEARRSGVRTRPMPKRRRGRRALLKSGMSESGLIPNGEESQKCDLLPLDLNVVEVKNDLARNLY